MRGRAIAGAQPGNTGLRVFKGLLAAVSVTLAAIMIFALIIKMIDPPDSIIAPVNQAIKLLSIFIGAWIAVGNGGERGFLKGAILGLSYMLIGIIVFSLLEGRVSAPVVLASDIGMGILAGALSGIIAANLRQKKC